MPVRRAPSLVRIGSALGLVLVLAGCTKGGQFDPTDVFNSDMFDSKKKLQGQREPLFPNGVPGTETGVPQDLVKGYQPPPEPATDAADNTGAVAAPEAEAAKPKPKPKPKLARVPAQRHDTAFDQKTSHPAVRINVGTAKPAVPAQSAVSSSQSVWPAPPPTAPAAQTGQSAQSIWPAPPRTAPAQQTAQPAQSIWPNPPATGTSSQ